MYVAACMYVYELHACLGPAEARRGHWIAWKYRLHMVVSVHVDSGC